MRTSSPAPEGSVLPLPMGDSDRLNPRILVEVQDRDFAVVELHLEAVEPEPIIL